MRCNWINAIVATLLAGLLAWWLWTMGIEDLQKWLLAGEGGAIIWIGLLGGMGFTYDQPRSGSQVKIVMFALSTITFGACCVYSFFRFSPEGFCIPLAIFALLLFMLARKVYRTKE